MKNKLLADAIAQGKQDFEEKQKQEREQAVQKQLAEQERRHHLKEKLRVLVGDAKPLFEAIRRYTREHLENKRYALYFADWRECRNKMTLSDETIKQLVGNQSESWELAEVLSEIDGITACYWTKFVKMDDDGNGYDAGYIDIRWEG
jgi:hypothetical protein